MAWGVTPFIRGEMDTPISLVSRNNASLLIRPSHDAPLIVAFNDVA